MIQKAAKQEVAESRALSERLSRMEREQQLKDERRFLLGIIPVVEERHRLSEQELRVLKNRLAKVEEEISTIRTPRRRPDD